MRIQPSRSILPALLLLLAGAAPVHAKLPPLGDEAKAKATEAAAKTAWSDKVGGYKLCEAMNRTADAYRTAMKASGKEAPAAVETPPCADPGAYVPPVAAPPLEAAGAHSPATMATSPPNSKATAAEQQGQPKK
jgi:hypothetical protein